LTVSKASQTITFNPLPDKSYGAADFGVSATASSGLAVSFSSQTTSVCTVAGSTVHILAWGTCSIAASQIGNNDFNAAPGVTQSFTVSKAVLTVKANDASMTYGGKLPTFSAAYSGFVNNETASVLTGNPSFTPTTAPAAAGAYPITPAQGTLAAANYNFTFVNGTLTVNKAVLTITANDTSMTYGGTLPAFSAAYSGFVNNDT
jgi:hypothetical protein